ncbi:MAG: family 16 glycosylhydrolase, partial [Candidatus Solibacter sp.]
VPAANGVTNLVWSDEFNGSVNTSPSSQNWAFNTGAGGWGNQELETYTSSTSNVYQDGAGNLVIRAMYTPGVGYTSGRLTTQNSMSASYGRVEARIKLPAGKGIWPSFWMLGNTISKVGWPECGEVDIMENLGDQPGMIHSTIHGPGYQNGIGVSNTLPSGNFSSDFHIFGMVWSPNSVQFQVDSVTYATMTPASLPAGASWVFNQPFFLLLNVAVGGKWSGNPDATTVFPQSMLVDYVRYYRDANVPVINPGQVLNSSTFTSLVAPGSVVALSGTGFSEATSTNLLTTHLPTSFNGTSVMLDKKPAFLVSVSPTLILAQVPWDVTKDKPVGVQVFRGGHESNAETISTTAITPSLFLQNGVPTTWCGSGAPKAGTTCTVFGDGFGAVTIPLQNGYPALAIGDPLQATCQLKIAGLTAKVSYCGLAPGMFVNRLDFVYPSGVPRMPATAAAVLTVGSKTFSFQMPSPQ